MVTLKVMLDKRRPKKNQELNVVIRVTNNRVAYFIKTDVSVTSDLWNENQGCILSEFSNATKLNAIISNKFFKVKEVTQQLENESNFSIEELKQRLNGNSKIVEPKKEITFNEFCNTLIINLTDSKRAGNAQVYSVARNRLLKYAGNQNIPFKEIDYQFLEAFTDGLRGEGIKPNTISNYLRTIRAIFNKAIKAKIVERTLYPFYDIQIKGERTQKRSISKEDILKLYNSDVIVNSKEWHAKNYFFLSYALIGASFTDMAYLKAENIVAGRVKYRRRKTKKLYDIKLTPLAKQILKLYKPDKYLLPIFPSNINEDGIESKYITRQAIKSINKYLKRMANRCDIELNMTSYVARHSWATIAKKLGYSNELIAESLGHEYGNKITNIYLDSFDQHIIDDLNLKVQEGLFK